MPELSNEAEELHKMCMTVNAYEANQSTLEALAALFDVKSQSAEYFSFVSAIQLRFQKFQVVVGASHLNDRHRAKLLSAINHLKSFTDFRYTQISWRDTRINVFQETHLTALDMAGSGLAALVPVVVPDADERQGYVDELKLALEEIGDPDDFVGQMARTAMQTAIKMVELFDIFGSGTVSEKLIEAHALTKQAAILAPQDRRSSYARAAGLIAIVLGGLVYADGVVSAVENFYTRAKPAIERLMLESPPAQKLLSAPVENTPDEPSAAERNHVEI